MSDICSPSVEALLNTVEAARVLNLSPRTLEDYRGRQDRNGGGVGPRYLALARNCIRYRHRDLMAWAEARGRFSTWDGLGSSP